MRDFSTITSQYGKTVVALSTWRNANATAFASVTIGNPWQACAHCAEAKSQGPSAGGFSKPTQALERLTDKLRLSGIIPDINCQRPEAWAQALAQIAESARVTGTIPAWKA